MVASLYICTVYLAAFLGEHLNGEKCQERTVSVLSSRCSFPSQPVDVCSSPPRKRPSDDLNLDKKRRERRSTGRGKVERSFVPEGWNFTEQKILENVNEGRSR